MPAPTNISFATATDVGTLSRDTVTTITQQVDDAGTTYTVWYKYTAVTGDTEISVFPFGDLAVYLPDVTFWLDASTQYLFNDAQNRPSQIPVTPGVTYGIKISPNGGNPSPANLTLKLQLGPDDQLSAGQLAINDSTDGYPAVVMNPSTGEPMSFHPFSAGEGVCVLRSGIICALDIGISGTKIYDQHLDVTIVPTMPATGYTTALGTNQIDTFIASKGGGGATHGFVVLITHEGTVGTPVDTGAAGCATVTLNAAADVCYFARTMSVANTAVLQMTLPAGVVTTFKAGVAGKFIGANVMTMTDDTVLIPYEEASVDTIIRRYDAAGVEQSGSPYTLTGVQNALERMFADPADPTYFWVWWQTSTDNRFQKIKVSDGSISTDLTWPKFVEGDYQGAASATPDAMFGADFSCVPWILRGTTTTQTFTIRRQRRFLLPSSPDNKWMQIPTIEILMRTGIGLTPGPSGSPVQGQDPQVMFRLSKDGGKTWLPERSVSAAEQGRFKDRVRLLQATGNYRNGVLEVTVSDPVDAQFLAAIGNPVEGPS